MVRSLLVSENANIKAASYHHMDIIYYNISIKTKNTHNRESPQIQDTPCFVFLYQEHLLTLAWHVQGSLHSCRPMIFYVVWTPTPKSTTPVFPLHHFSRLSWLLAHQVMCSKLKIRLVIVQVTKQCDTPGYVHRIIDQLLCNDPCACVHIKCIRECSWYNKMKRCLKFAVTLYCVFYIFVFLLFFYQMM